MKTNVRNIFFLLATCGMQILSNVSHFAQGLQNVAADETRAKRDKLTALLFTTLDAFIKSERSRKTKDSASTEEQINHLIKQMKRLIDLGANPRGRDDKNNTLLYYAAGFGNKQLMQKLVQEKVMDAGYELNTKNTFDQTPLHAAMRSGNKDLVEYMMTTDAKADIASDDLHSRKPIHLAAQSGNKELMEYLVTKTDAKKYLRTPDKYGRTVIHDAVVSGKKELVQYLVQHTEAGQDIRKKDNEWNTPMHLATSATLNNDLLDYLLTTPAREDLVTKNKEGDSPIETVKRYHKQALSSQSPPQHTSEKRDSEKQAVDKTIKSGPFRK